MRITKKKYKYARSAFTHNPEVVGSSPASATKKDSQPFGWLSFFVMVQGLEEGGGSCETSAKKCPGDTFLARGSVHPCRTASVMDVGRHGSFLRQNNMGYPLIHILTHNRKSPLGQSIKKAAPFCLNGAAFLFLHIRLLLHF